MNGNGNVKKKRRTRIIIISAVVVVIVLIVGVAVAFSHGSSKIDPSKLAKVEKGDLAKSVVATGKVEPITKVEVKSKASGIVKKLYVEYGDRVKKGQLLAQLDKIEIEAGVEQSKAALLAAQANLKGSEADFDVARKHNAVDRRNNVGIAQLLFQLLKVGFIFGYLRLRLRDLGL